MPISFQCSGCGKAYNVREDLAGRKLKCKACEAVVRVPTDSAKPAAPQRTRTKRRTEPVEQDDFGSDRRPAPKPRRSQSASKPSRTRTTRSRAKASRLNSSQAEADDFGFDAAPLPPKKRRKKPKKRSLDKSSRPRQTTEELSRWMRIGQKYSDAAEDSEDWHFAGYCLVGIALTIGLPIACWFSFRIVYYGIASPNWPTVEGRITDAYVEKSTTRRRWRTRTTYIPNVQYTYAVDGENYNNDNLTYMSKGSSDPQVAMSRIQNFPPGSNSPIYYKPGNPSVSVLTPGADRATYMRLIIPAICLAGPYLAFRYGLALNYRLNADIMALRRRRPAD